MKRLNVYLLLLFSVTTWGGSFVAARMVLDPAAASVAGSGAGPAGVTTLTPIMLSVARSALASVILLPALVHQHLRVRRIEPRDAAAFLILGQLAVTVYFWLQYQGVRLTNAGVSSLVVVGLIPIATLLIASLVERTALGWRKTLAVALGLAGVAVVAGQKGLAVTVESGFLLGSVCLAADAVCFAIYTVAIRRLSSRYATMEITSAVHVSGTAGLLALATVEGGWQSFSRLAPVQWVAIAYLALACTIGAYLCYNYAVSRLEAGKAAVWIYLEPLVASVLGVLLLGETVTVHTFAGGVIIFASLYFTQRT
ncbi:MAG: EamA family transporter [Firmicutes bacterium]|nr:EamA family transporter [Bacillota bacterium]